ncbi:MAG: acetyl-CoA carboxylase carboxyl transferase subunit alpha, partial [Rhodospirillales bacterium]|nr:acetyl-CoA carboxylase carboxyl transferase subunit alpha [Rhodospirillales bacterium]
MASYLDFEKPIAELEGKVEELRRLVDEGDVNIAEEVTKLQSKADRLLETTYAKLTAWQKSQVARHANRPHTLNYIDQLVEEFTPLAGDRTFAEDAAIIGGLGRFRGQSVMIM